MTSKFQIVGLTLLEIMITLLLSSLLMTVVLSAYVMLQQPFNALTSSLAKYQRALKVICLFETVNSAELKQYYVKRLPRPQDLRWALYKNRPHGHPEVVIKGVEQLTWHYYALQDGRWHEVEATSNLDNIQLIQLLFRLEGDAHDKQWVHYQKN